MREWKVGDRVAVLSGAPYGGEHVTLATVERVTTRRSSGHIDYAGEVRAPVRRDGVRDRIPRAGGLSGEQDQGGQRGYLPGYGTHGRVMDEHQQSGIRMLTVAWHTGGFHTASEDGWRLVSQDRRTRALTIWVAGIVILGLVVFSVVNLALAFLP